MNLMDKYFPRTFPQAQESLKKEDKKLKIKQFQMYNLHRQNCSNTKQKFFTENMEIVQELNFEDPNKDMKQKIIENQKQQNGFMDSSNKLIQTFSEST